MTPVTGAESPEAAELLPIIVKVLPVWGGCACVFWE